MIDLEDGHREPLEARPAHTPPLDVIVSGIALVARDTHQLTLESASRALLPGGGAGSHVDVILPNGLQRQYSLLDSGPQLQAYRIAVKLDPASRGGSRYIVGQLRVGEQLRVSHPRNNFPLYKDAAHSVFIAGGIGITPVFSMIRRLRELGRRWSLHYACRSRAEAAYVRELEAMPEAHCHFDDEQGRLLDVAAVEAAAAPDAHLYCCGPLPMLAAFEAATAGRPRDHVHVEYFAPRKAEAQANAAGFVVALAKTGKEYVVPPGVSILSVLRDAGVDVSYSCETGVCAACETRVLSGIPEHRDSVLTEQERQANKTMMICCSGSRTPRLLLDL